MKTRMFVSILILVLAVLIIAGRAKKEELHGTWINEEYKGSNIPMAIQIYKPDGTFQYLRLAALSWEEDVERTEEGWIKGYEGPYEIIEKWTDEGGSVWYKTENHVTETDKHFVLIKINGSGSVLEYVWRQIEFAEGIDPNAATYGIFYRQE